MLDGRFDLIGPVERLRETGDLPELTEAEKELKRVESKVGEVEQVLEVKSDPQKVSKPARALHKAEERSAANVSWRVYKLYISVSGFGRWVIVALLFGLSQGTSIMSRFWLKIVRICLFPQLRVMPATPTFSDCV